MPLASFDTMSHAIPQQVLVAHLEGEAVILHMDTRRYYRLNETAAHIWKGLERRETIDRITDSLCRQFTVEPATARREVEEMVRDLLRDGLLTQG
jgi:hypothetical protein